MNEYNSIIDKLYSKPNLSVALLLSLIMILFTRRKQVKVTKNIYIVRWTNGFQATDDYREVT